jgi:hypothetical protein
VPAGPRGAAGVHPFDGLGPEVGAGGRHQAMPRAWRPS